MPPNTRCGCTNKPVPRDEDLLLIKRRDSCGGTQPQQSNGCFGSRFGLSAGHCCETRKSKFIKPASCDDRRLNERGRRARLWRRTSCNLIFGCLEGDARDACVLSETFCVDSLFLPVTKLIIGTLLDSQGSLYNSQNSVT